jgi:hypothetical protein
VEFLHVFVKAVLILSANCLLGQRERDFDEMVSETLEENLMLHGEVISERKFKHGRKFIADFSGRTQEDEAFAAMLGSRMRLTS